MTYDFTTFGEAMVRLSVRPGETVETATRLDFFTGGSEANTAVALARMGMKTAWVSRLTKNPLGRRVAGDIARHGVDISGVLWTDADRVGLYFVEFNPPPASAAVTYDRADSAFCRTLPRDLPWPLLLDTRVLHLTGNTPALSPNCRRAVLTAREKAREKKVPVSFDVNYRARLWKPAAAVKALLPLINDTALLVMTEEDAATLFHLKGAPERVAKGIRSSFKCQVAVLTLGARGAVAWDGKKLYAAPGFERIEVIDRVGAGDAFTAGLVYGWLRGDLAAGLRYGVAASALKMGVRGDQFLGGLPDVERLAAGRTGGINR